MKKKYEESLKTCILLARIIFFTIAADNSDKYQSEVLDKIFEIQCKLEHDRTAGGFIGGRYGVKWYQQIFTKLAVKIGFTNMCPIFRLPGFYAFDNANPRAAYQKWCAAFDGVLTESDIDLIVSSAIKNDDNFYEYGVQAYKNMQDQKRWTLAGELYSIWLYWKKTRENVKNQN
ncbi:hypothetical protein [uncultured Treponema sp.]|uniref:hypothetical protein n=1 Tax=uncultured Treponema sp. TaxID=162155 RepID=UPI00258B28C1|nr:hypothetical protein [uncultured Treponema sp.]